MSKHRIPHPISDTIERFIKQEVRYAFRTGLLIGASSTLFWACLGWLLWI
jgi:hypothetical protein